MPMRAQLESVIEELKTLRAEGIEGIYLEEGTLARLRAMAQVPAARTESPSVAERTPTAVKTEAEQEPHVNLLANWKSEAESDAPAPKAKPKVRDQATQSSLPTGLTPIPAPRPFQLVDGDKATRWSALRDVVMGDPVCQEHARLDRGNRVVFGMGSLDADIFFCGEAPGADEALRGEPFVGKPGQLLDKIIKAMGLSRAHVYLSDVMSWRPEQDKPFGNRPATDEELAYCLPYLQAQVDIIQPKVIVALGDTVAKALLGLDAVPAMETLRGQWLEYRGCPLIVTDPPSALLQKANDASKRLLWEDMLMVMDKVELPISEKQRGYFLPK